jgi:uncharacterized protein
VSTQHARSDWAFSTRELGHRAGEMRAHTRTVTVPEGGFGVETIAVAAGEPVELDIRLEAVTEGVYVSGTAHAHLTGECARCLDPISDEVTVEIGELYAYPDSATDETTEEDELPRVIGSRGDEHVDLEQTVRDALVGDLPLAPLCRPDCPGLCAECGEKWADLPAGHGHETLDPRWAALRERLPAE